MEISVIVPTYNRVSLLDACVDSLLNQTINHNYEIIIVDNNSSDSTETFIKKKYSNQAKVRYIKELRKGLVYSRHTGMAISKSNILIFVDDDALYNEKMIEEMYNVYKLNENTVAVGGKIEIKWDTTIPEWLLKYEKLLGKLDYGKDIIFSDKIFINGGLFSIKKNILIDVGGFNPDQVDNLLIGDGEAGLCKKLHLKKYLMAWTPYAVMQHIQFLNKNGTIKDIGRRHYNNGICESYGILKENNFTFNSLCVKYFIKKIKKLIWTSLKYYTHKSKEYYFELQQIKGEIHFIYLWLNPKYRNTVKKNNWF